jgi:hypothetical protein
MVDNILKMQELWDYVKKIGKQNGEKFKTLQPPVWRSFKQENG